MLGIVAAQDDYDWERVRQHFQRALELDPASTSAIRFDVIWYLRPPGRLEEAMESRRPVQ